jgi:hypothetical protein
MTGVVLAAMTRVHAWAVGALVLLAALAAGEAGAAGKRPLKCPPSRGRLVAADARAELYSIPGPRRPFRGEESATIVGCLRHGRAYALGPAPFGTAAIVDGVFEETLAGSVVAYERFCEVFALGTTLERLCGAQESELVVVRDLRTGRVIHRVPTGSPPSVERVEPSQPGGRIGAGRMTAIVVRSDGAVAWIVDTRKRLGTFELHELDRSGARIAAAGSDIDPHSLALAGGTIYWTQGGRPFSAPLD